MRWLRWNEVQKQDDLASFAVGPEFSMLKQENGAVISKGLLTHVELLEGNYPQQFLVLFILRNNSTLLIEIYDYHFASLLVSKKIHGRLTEGGIIKVSETELYFLCDDGGIYHLNTHILHHQNQGIFLAEEEMSSIIKNFLTKHSRKKNIRTKICQNRLLSVEKGTLHVRSLDTGKKMISKKVTKGIISVIDGGADYLFCGVRGKMSGFPDPHSEIIVLDINSLNIVCRQSTEFSFHTSLACTIDGASIACHQTDSSLHVLRLEHEAQHVKLVPCIEQVQTSGHPDLLKFSADSQWLFFGNHDGVHSLVSKNIVPSQIPTYKLQESL